MQQVNDDMDELFRRAAEGYPLNTDSADWEAVAKKLSDNTAITADNPEKKENKRRALWLLLLLPLAFAYYTYYYNGIGKDSARASISPEKISASSPGNSEKTSATPPSNVSAQYSSQTPDGNVIADAAKNTTKQVSLSLTHSLISNGNDNEVNKSSLLGLSYNKNSNPPSQLADRLASAMKISLSTQSTEKVDKKDNVSAPEAITKDKTVINANELLSKPVAENKKPEVKPLNIASVDTPAIKKSQKIKLKQRKYGLYAGVIISPDLSTVKLQSVKKIGVNLGVIMGYTFNNKLSVESGVLWDKKQYYSEGKYFNTKNIYLRANTSIHDVTGVCYMIEVPLNIRYNFTSQISTSAGVSSYFMKKEKYDYSIINTAGQYPYSASYNRPTTNIAAVANFSVGYNPKLTKNTKLLVEPYLKIPLKKLGIGSLPIMSTGINIGITKKLSR